jgi:hypothetical protein
VRLHVIIEVEVDLGARGVGTSNDLRVCALRSALPLLKGAVDDELEPETGNSWPVRVVEAT